MLYKRKDESENLCILAISLTVLDLDETIISDRNASSNIACFSSAFQGINELDYERVLAKYWEDDNPILKAENKAIKCAEVLIPKAIPPEYITGACVNGEAARKRLEETGFNKPIHIDTDKKYFF